MRYEAIIFDLDGTAMPSQEVSLPSEKMAMTTKKYREKVHLCAATGRSWQNAKKIVQALGLIDPCIVSGGAVIIDPKDEKILWQVQIYQDSLELILKAIKQFDFNIVFATGMKF